MMRLAQTWMGVFFENTALKCTAKSCMFSYSIPSHTSHFQYIWASPGLYGRLLCATVGVPGPLYASVGFTGLLLASVAGSRTETSDPEELCECKTLLRCMPGSDV